MNNGPDKICFYVMTSDTGLAPNPFHGFCTLALCTPNHMRARLKKGDWIVGCFRSGELPRVVYIMRIDEVMPLDNYYNDSRFSCKKPLNSNWKAKVGDNIYYMNTNGILQQDPNTQFHKEENVQTKDKRGNKVFIGRQFIYFGRKAIDLPRYYNKCLPRTQGIKYLPSNDPLYQQFLSWGGSFLGKGIMGDPRDSKIHIANHCESCQ